MSTGTKNSGYSEKNSDNSRNNNGTIGGAGGIDKEPKGSFHKMVERVKEGNAPNVRGIRENEERHGLGNQKHDRGHYEENEIDPNMPEGRNSDGKKIEYPKTGYNHVDNPGGTSADELNENN